LHPSKGEVGAESNIYERSRADAALLYREIYGVDANKKQPYKSGGEKNRAEVKARPMNE
jgi:hypothetical protein